MTRVWAVASRVIVLSMTIGVAVYTAVSYSLPVLLEITAVSLLLIIILLIRGYLSRHDASGLPDPVGLFVIVFSIATTVQALEAREIYGPLLTIDTAPGYAIVVRLVHYLVVILVMLAGHERNRLVGLGAAMVYTSILYVPTFAAPEAGPPFSLLMALGLVLLITTPARQTIPLTKHFALLTVVALFATLTSYARCESIIWCAKLLALGLLMLVTPLIAKTRLQWKRAAFLIIIMSLAVPVLLSAAKLLELVWQLGFWSAIHYRMGLTELGRSNLMARTLMIGTPVLISVCVATRNRIAQILLWGSMLIAAFIFVSCQSWGGWIGMGVTLITVLGVAYGGRFVSALRKHRSLIPALAILTMVFGLTLIWLATQVNITSFNGRVIHFRIAMGQAIAHPLLGVGPGHTFLNSHHAGTLQWLTDNQYSQDNPLWVLGVSSVFPLLHSHNLLLEVSAGLGLFGALALLFLLVEFFSFGLRTRSQSWGSDRILLTGCLIGIVAALGWGLLDVMEISPPFFTFPVWALAGLVLAAPQAFGVEPGREESKNGMLARSHRLWLKVRPRPSVRVAQALRMALLVILAIFVVALPLVGNLHYKRGYTAYQEQRWAEAVNGLVVASRWEPLNAKYQQLRAEALINLGHYEEATAAYERAAKLRREFAPYHSQLGWLAWLQGDLEQATDQFERAVEMDPREAWRDGLHADLGLAYTAQGWIEEASLLFGETIKLDPQMAGAVYWVPIAAEAGRLDLVLDSVYLEEPSSELEKRILAHLGKTDYEPRLFHHEHAARSPITLHSVLDGIEEEYQAALEEESRGSPRLLATVAEAARVVGLEDRAERTYLAFQAAFPESVYGFRDLGALYREQGRLQEAQEQLEQAIQVSSRDTASWLDLARVYLAEEMVDEAQATLDTVYNQDPLEPDLYELRAQLHLKKGETAQAADALGRALVIEESVPNRLALADLYGQLGEPRQATEQCTKAKDALLRTWPRPLDGTLWEIGACLAQSEGGETLMEIEALAREEPLIGNVLQGHIFRARGELEQALSAYQAAAAARPDEGAPHYFLGETYQALGQPEIAAAEYLQAATLDPLESLPLLALGQMQWGMGGQEAALETFLAAVEATPGWGQAHVALGNALLALGDYEGAGEHYQRAQLADRDIQEGLVHDFAVQLADAEVDAPDAGYVKNDYFTIDGDARRVLFMHPDSSARYTIEVPEDASLAFAVATSPESWDQPGDGTTFAVYLQSDEGIEQIFSTYIDPKQEETHRRWHPHTVDLGEYAGQSVTIILETTSGPAGDNRFDWAGWGTPQLQVP